MTHALRHALAAKEAGYRVVITRDKSPIRKGWTEESPDESMISFHLRHEFGYGIRTDPPLCVIDVDGPAEGLTVETPFAVRSRKGMHLYVRLPEGTGEVRARIRLLGTPLDVIVGANRFLVGPGTTIARPEPWTYELVGRIVPVAELPECPAEIVAELTRPVIETTRRSIARAFHPSRRAVRDPEAYCLRIPSVQGENGSGALVRCVAILRDAGRSPDEILAYLTDVWNPQCARPLWSPEELRRAVQRHGS